ncbi:MAG: glycosyltransferase [Elusimicrobiales bacterium]
MRILYVITSTSRGGAENTLLKIVSGLNRAKYEPVCAVSLKHRGHLAADIENAGVPVETLGSGYAPAPFDVMKLSRIIARHKPDVIHALLYRAIQFCRLARRGGAALLTSPRVNYRTRALPLLWLDALTRTKDEFTVCESSASRDFLVGSLGYDPARAAVIRNGVDTVKWRFHKALRDAKRAELGLGPQDVLVVAAGRLDEQKGHRYLIDAAAILKLRLVILGEGPLRAQLEARARARGLRGDVLPGEQEDLRPWLCAADIFALPSLWEGTPNALMEAMSMGLPSVASAVDGVREIAADGETAKLVPPADTGALADALAQLAAGAEFRQAMGAAARRRAENDFSLARMMAQYEAAYDIHSSFVRCG